MWFWISVGIAIAAVLLWAWRIDRRQPGLKVTRRKGGGVNVEVGEIEATLRTTLPKSGPPQ